MSEPEPWSSQLHHLASLTNLLQQAPGKVFTLDNPQTGFPALPILLITSLLILIQKDKVMHMKAVTPMYKFNYAHMRNTINKNATPQPRMPMTACIGAKITIHKDALK